MAITENNQNTDVASDFGSIIGRLIAAAVVLGTTAFFTPGFAIANIWTLIVAAVVLTLMDYGLIKLFGIDATPFGRGVLGFVLAAAIIYATKFIVAGYNVTLIGAIIAALIFGIVDAILPGNAL